MERAAPGAHLRSRKSIPPQQPLNGRTDSENLTNQEIAMNTFITFTSSVVLSLIAANAAYAGDPTSAPKSLTVQFADLDLSKLEGAATLFGRLRNAAQTVCSAHRGGASLRDKQQYAACTEFALSNAVARVDRPVLTQYVIDRTSIKPTASIKVASDR